MACLAHNPVREPESFKILKRAGWTRISKLTPQQRRMSSFAYFERDGSIQPLPKDGSLPHGITLSELERRANPIFLPKSLFDSYVVKSDGGEVTVDRIQTLKGAEKKVAELARKYPCVGFNITSAKHGGVIKHYAASVGRGGPRVDKDNSREYKREATQAAKDSVRFRLFVNGSEYADYETKGEAEKVGKKEAGSGGKWTVKQVAANPNLPVIHSAADARREAMARLRDNRRQNDAEFAYSPSTHAVGMRWHDSEIFRVFNVAYPMYKRSDEVHDWVSVGKGTKQNPSKRHGYLLELFPQDARRIERKFYGQGSAMQRAIDSGIKASHTHKATAFYLTDMVSAKTYSYDSHGNLTSRNPLTGVPAHDIPLELRHGRSQREAVAMALSEQRRVAENPVEVFMSERDARRFAASTLGASVIPGQSGGWVVVYPVGGRTGRNPAAKVDYVVTYFYANGTRNREYFTVKAEAERQLRKYYRNHKGGHGEITTQPHLTTSQRQFGVRNPVINGTGEVLDSHDDHASAPYVHVLAKYGYRYSHSTPVHYRSGVRIHHTWATFRERPSTPDYPTQYSVGAWVGHDGDWFWESGKSGSSQGRAGRTPEELDKYLKGLMKRIGTNSVPGRKSSSTLQNPNVPQTDYDFKMQVKQLGSGHERYTNLKETERKVRTLYKAFRTYQHSHGFSNKEYPNWSPSQKMPRWIAEPFYEGYTQGSKRNPSDEDAATMYETFHGEPSEEVLEYHVEEFERVDWATLGDLIQLKVETSTGKLVELNAPDPERSTIEDVIKLVCSPDGKQMAFVGGDQCLDEATLTRLGFTEADIRDNMVIGLVREFTYRTQKAFDKFKTIDYYHEAGEEHPVRKVFDDFRRKPTLLYCPHDGLMKLAGGLYKVKDVGVVN